MPSLCFLEENLNEYIFYDFRDVCKRHQKDGKQVKSVSLKIPGISKLNSMYPF